MSDDQQQQRDREEAVAWVKEKSLKMAGAQWTTWIRWSESDARDSYLAGLRAERERERILHEAVREVLDLVPIPGMAPAIGWNCNNAEPLNEERRAALVAVLEGGKS